MGMPAPSFTLVNTRATDPKNCNRFVNRLCCPVLPCTAVQSSQDVFQQCGELWFRTDREAPIVQDYCLVLT